MNSILFCFAFLSESHAKMRHVFLMIENLFIFKTFFAKMKVGSLIQNIKVKEKIAKITFLMKDVHCPCTQRKLKAH